MARLLLVEDNELNRDMLCRRLQRRGHEVLLAADGQQGIDLALVERPALILLDMSLPGLDGWEPPAGSRPRRRRGPPRSSPSRRTPWPATGSEPWRPAATTTTPSPWSSRLLAKIDALLARAG